MREIEYIFFPGPSQPDSVLIGSDQSGPSDQSRCPRSMRVCDLVGSESELGLGALIIGGGVCEEIW